MPVFYGLLWLRELIINPKELEKITLLLKKKVLNK
jgi:hypothetical protein